jgi:hypothetical protein
VLLRRAPACTAAYQPAARRRAAAAGVAQPTTRFPFADFFDFIFHAVKFTCINPLPVAATPQAGNVPRASVARADWMQGLQRAGSLRSLHRAFFSRHMSLPSGSVDPVESRDARWAACAADGATARDGSHALVAVAQMTSIDNVEANFQTCSRLAEVRAARMCGALEVRWRLSTCPARLAGRRRPGRIPAFFARVLLLPRALADRGECQDTAPLSPSAPGFILLQIPTPSACPPPAVPGGSRAAERPHHAALPRPSPPPRDVALSGRVPGAGPRRRAPA